MSRRKKQRSREAVPEEVLAEGSGPHDVAQSAEELATAASEALEQPVVDDEPVVDEPIVEAAADEPAADDVVEAVEDEAALEAASDAPIDGEPGDDDPDAVGDVAAVLPTSAASLDDLALKHLVEAIVFASDKPVTLQRLRQLSRISDTRRIEAALAQLAVDFADRGIALQHVSGGYQFRTNSAYSQWVQQLIAGRPVRLSRAQLETLAIVAYRQPITRPEIDEIRGVDSSATLRLLLDRSLIRVLGKREEVGRPMLYGTTGEFLDFFSLQDLRELPTLREYSELTAESRQVMSDRLGVPMEAEVPPAVAEEPVETTETIVDTVVDGQDVAGEPMFIVEDGDVDGSAIEAVETAFVEPAETDVSASYEAASVDVSADADPEAEIETSEPGEPGESVSDHDLDGELD